MYNFSIDWNLCSPINFSKGFKIQFSPRLNIAILLLFFFSVEAISAFCYFFPSNAWLISSLLSSTFCRPFPYGNYEFLRSWKIFLCICSSRWSFSFLLVHLTNSTLRSIDLRPPVEYSMAVGVATKNGVRKWTIFMMYRHHILPHTNGSYWAVIFISSLLVCHL